MRNDDAGETDHSTEISLGVEGFYCRKDNNVQFTNAGFCCIKKFYMNPESTQNALIQNAPRILEKYPVLFAYLYGSYATGAVHPFSDVDIGIYIRGVAIERHLEIELTISLEIDSRLTGNAQSDVHVINGLPLSFLGQILTEGVLIYSIDEVSRVDFETSARIAYFDFLPVLKMYQKEYIKRALS